MQTRWRVAENDADWLEKALEYVRQAEAEALGARGVFHIVLAGGGTPKRLYEALAVEPRDWARWRVWYGDERCLPPDDAERNSRMAELAWLGKVALPTGNVHVIPAERGPVAAAEAYAESLGGVELFDLVLLGLGEDGHAASLFPGREWGEEADVAPALPVFDAPKPPPERVSLSAYRLGLARRVLFLVAGVGKQAAVRAWRHGATLPAAAIRPEAGVDVLLDELAWGDER